MIWFQAAWGVFLAGMLGYTFRRACRWEDDARNNIKSPNKYGRETFIFLAPTTLFWILLVCFAIFVYALGLQEAALRFSANLADVLLILSVYFVLLLILLPILRKSFSARACAVLWLVPAFLSWQAHILLQTIPIPRLTLYIPGQLIPVIGAVWLAGFVLVGGYYLISHLIFFANVRKISEDEADPKILALWKKQQEAIDYLRPVRLLRGDVPAPFSMGRTRLSRCTVLPRRSYTMEELTMIFSHELHHLQRCDVDTKVFFCMCRALCWFNPLVWIATKKAAEDLELSCDEIVTEGMSEPERRAYAEVLLDAAAPIKGCTTCLSAAAGTLRYRLKGVMDQKKRLRGTVILMIALFCCVMCFGSVSVSDRRGNFTSMIFAQDVKIDRVYDPNYSADTTWDREALNDLLEDLELEHITRLMRRPYSQDDEITLVLSDGGYVRITKSAVYVENYRKMRYADCYLIKSGLDWNALKACIGDR